jgi:protease II
MRIFICKLHGYCPLTGAWVAVPSVLDSEGLFLVAALTVPSLDPLSEVISGAYGWHELGCPQQREVYPVAKACCPLDVLTMRDVQSQASSALGTTERMEVRWLIRSGLFDDRVGFWEHSSFVAMLRAYVTNRKGGPLAQPVMLRVRAGNHACFESLLDDVELCVFILS